MTTPRPICVLLVEDSVTDALLIGEALSDVPDFLYELTHVELLSDGLIRARETRFDIVMLDLGLPDAQGIDTFRRFHRQMPDLPVLVLTGLDDMAMGLLAIQEGAQDYLLKNEIQASLLGRALHYALERHHVAVSLAASEERFQLAVSGAAAGLWDSNLKTGTMYFSPHFKEIMAYEDNELPNEANAHEAAIHPDDVGRVTAAQKAHLKTRSPYDVEYRLRRKTGDYCWIQSRGQALWDQSGEPYRMVGWIQDISDRKLAEDELRISREELRLLSANIQQAREEERKRVARELHDDLGQQLTALKMDVALLGGELESAERPSPEDKLLNVYALIDQLASSVRRIAADLRPLMLDDLGLIPAIEWLVHEFSVRHNIQVTTHINASKIDFNRESGTEVFRMIQEALTNVARHADATEVVLDIVRDASNCIVRIADNGRGAVRDRPPDLKSFGLLGQRERAARLGGETEIRTAPGQGFALAITLPLATVEASEPG